jgi:hypothetical protein
MCNSFPLPFFSEGIDRRVPRFLLPEKIYFPERYIRSLSAKPDLHLKGWSTSKRNVSMTVASLFRVVHSGLYVKMSIPVY